MKKDIKFELSYLQLALDQIEAYLLSNELFWPVSPPAGIRAYPKMTLGNVILAMKKLNAGPGFETQSEISQLTEALQSIRQKWKAAWENKARREFTSRLRQWTHYLNDLEKNEETHAPYYSSEVRVRVLIALLEEFASSGEKQSLSQLDLILERKLQSSDFIWDVKLQAVFPQDMFWFLYGTI